MLPLQEHLIFNKSIFMYKYFSGLLPMYLNDVLPKIKQPRYNTSRCTLEMIKPRIDLVKTSLCYSGGILWERLPTEIRSAKSLSCFKKLAFDYFFNKERS